MPPRWGTHAAVSIGDVMPSISTTPLVHTAATNALLSSSAGREAAWFPIRQGDECSPQVPSKTTLFSGDG